MRKLQLENIGREALLETVRPWLADTQSKLHDAFLADQDAERLTFALSSLIDHLIETLFAYFTEGKPTPLAVVATGGYGRREQCPYSDIDLLFLYAPAHSKTSAALAESLLYILWDLGLKVGQAHRTTIETLTLALDDIQVRTSLLDARLIAGDKAIFSECMERLEKEIVEGSELFFVEAKLAERDVRHARFGDSRYVLEPNVKEGKGGLRDLHTLWWLARYAYRVRSLNELVELGHLTPEELAAFHHASQFLLRTRIHLHYQAGHADERLSFDKQLAMARAMGYKNTSPNLAITRFMRRYFIAVRTVGGLTRIFCALLEDEKKRKPTKPLGWAKLGKNETSLFELDGERLSIADEQAFLTHPTAMLTLFYVAQEQALDIHPRALRQVTRNLHLIDDAFRKDPEACRIFLRILQSAKGPEITLRRMSEAGVLGRFIPEFGRIVGQTQFNMYHVYTVDEHTLMALGILHAIDQGLIQGEAPMASDIMPRITQKHVLYLALFCHDIAKGRGSDHSELGEHIAVKLSKRFGFSDEESDAAAWLVRNHLLLSGTAFKRDLGDPKTIADFVALVQTPERLKLLLVLTVADIRAVGPGVWNEWKGSLMRDLFNRSMQAMGSSETSGSGREPDMLKKAIAEHYPTVHAQAIDDYLSLATDGFFNGLTIPQHLTAAKMRLIDAAGKKKLQLHITHDEKRFVTEIIICAPDMPGIFARLTGAITLAGASIIHAKIFTLKDGTAVDIFHLQDVAGNAFNRPSMLAKMAVYIEQAMEGSLDVSQALARRAAPYEHPPHEQMKKEGLVFIENDASAVCSVIEIAANDRIGLLYDVANALTRLGLSIVTAHISTYGNQIADVFYVKNSFGMKILHADKIKTVREALAKVL
ncbi:MAG: [protein-PII] uridylyltransferase [Alphaproteobacteria bacterium]|nr:[protein-PII] uridylyltransferase [Alphaproteobacteria bacterium]